jgi:hypothetical protein
MTLPKTVISKPCLCHLLSGGIEPWIQHRQQAILILTNPQVLGWAGSG